MTDLKGTPRKVESEKLLERKLTKAIQYAGGMSIKLSAQYFTGLPDRMILLPEGIIFFAEIKTTGKKPTKLQSIVHDKIRALGFKVLIVDCSEDIDLIVTNIKNRQNGKI